MITDALLRTIYQIIYAMIFIFPPVGFLPEPFYNSLSGLAPFLAKVNVYIPVDQVFLIFQYYLLMESGILTFKMINWAFNKARGSG